MLLWIKVDACTQCKTVVRCSVGILIRHANTFKDIYSKSLPVIREYILPNADTKFDIIQQS